MMNLIVACALIFVLPLLQGCLPLMIAGSGYAIGQGRKGTAAQMEAKGKFLDRYNTYKIEMEKINLEREKASLQPKIIDDFDVWLNQQPLTPEEQALYRVHKSQTPNEVKEIDAKKREEKEAATKKKEEMKVVSPASNLK